MLTCGRRHSEASGVPKKQLLEFVAIRWLKREGGVAQQQESHKATGRKKHCVRQRCTDRVGTTSGQAIDPAEGPTVPRSHGNLRINTLELAEA